MIACSHEHLAEEFWKSVHWVKKASRFQIWQTICSQSNYIYMYIYIYIYIYVLMIILFDYI